MLDGRTDPAFLLYSPTGLAIDQSGFIYVTDSAAFVRQLYGGQLRSVAGTGDRGYAGDSNFATSARLTGPHDLAFDAKGSPLYRRWLLCAQGFRRLYQHVAGNGYAWAIGDGLPATLAQLKSPGGPGARRQWQPVYRRYGYGAHPQGRWAWLHRDSRRQRPDGL